MPVTDSLTPIEWFSKAEEDLAAARVLLAGEPQLPSIAAFHLQQAVEKYLKGFLLVKGWSLQQFQE
jgi:HEPN domain-containing protein